jgi:hypothetical protein
MFVGGVSMISLPFLFVFFPLLLFNSVFDFPLPLQGFSKFFHSLVSFNVVGSICSKCSFLHFNNHFHCSILFLGIKISKWFVLLNFYTFPNYSHMNEYIDLVQFSCHLILKIVTCYEVKVYFFSSPWL